MGKETETPKDPTMAEVMAMLARIAQENQALQRDALIVNREQLKQTRNPSNKKTHGISAWNPQGQNFYPMPDLKCEFWMPWPERPTDNGFTWEERELANLLEPGEYDVTLRDDTVVKANLIADRHPSTGKVMKMALMGAMEPGQQPATFYTPERKHIAPGLVPLFREMLRQKGIDDRQVLTMKERERRCRLPETDPLKLPVAVGE